MKGRIKLVAKSAVTPRVRATISTTACSAKAERPTLAGVRRFVASSRKLGKLTCQAGSRTDEDYTPVLLMVDQLGQHQ